MEHPPNQAFRQVGIFIGDGEKYDKIREPSQPIRIGSILYQVVEVEVREATDSEV